MVYSWELMMRVYFAAVPETFSGLSGLRYLMATIGSLLSRNYRIGYGLAQGKTSEQALIDLQSTVEMVNTTHVLADLVNQKKNAIPIACQVYRFLKRKTILEGAILTLMEQALKLKFFDLEFQ